MMSSAAATSETTTPKESHDDIQRSNSMPLSVAIYWMLPMLCIAILSRFAVDTGPAFLPQQSRPVSVTMKEQSSSGAKSAPVTQETQTTTAPVTDNRGKQEGNMPYLSNKPYSYQEVVKAISRRRLDWKTASTEPIHQGQAEIEEKTRDLPKNSAPPAVNTNPTDSPPPRGASSDPARLGLLEKINQLRNEYNFADALRLYDVQYHDGGTMQKEAIETYQTAIEVALKLRNEKIESGEETNRSLDGVVDVNEEIVLDYTARSIDGILCALFTSLGKVYFMANMFENAVEHYTKCIDIEPTYLDAVSSRGSSLIILGKYKEAATDFDFVIERDVKRRFLDTFTGLARVLQTKEEASPKGWGAMIQHLDSLIPLLEGQVDHIPQAEGRAMVASSLARLYHVMFLYHDSKTNDTSAAWHSLTKAYEYKMSSLPPWKAGFETQKVQATKQIFHKGFWPDVGSQSRVPIFIIGFVRSGSTLLERILDAHPQIAGTGENSVFNGQLDNIRNRIVQTSMVGDFMALKNEVQTLADEVLAEMHNRWNMVATAEERASNRLDPQRFVDKMLTNYYNVGFIHMLFPNALILHIAREPMDTIFSAYKHEFPSGPLDYTSSFESLAEMYQGYREVMAHWDSVLPGRIVHIKYEDLVRDTASLTKAIIGTTGLEWHDEILDFHKKKQAVNTLSTTQVRKGIYTDSLSAWRKYETQLQPLVALVGAHTEFPLETTAPGYSKHGGDEAKTDSEVDASHKDEL